MNKMLEKILEEYPLKMTDVADACNVSRVRVQQLVSQMEEEELLSIFIGNIWRFKPGAIEWVRNRDNRRK